MSKIILFFKTFFELLLSSAPLIASCTFLKTKILRILHARDFAKLRSIYQNLQSNPNFTFSNDWFTPNAPYWVLAFNKIGLHPKCEIKMLEIGSWEGRSSSFLLTYFVNGFLTCVDTWEGADEHKNQSNFETIEANFDANLTPFKGRFNKIKSSSFNFFATIPQSSLYDLIYIDGSHYVDDVLIDAICSFQKLRSGGLLIFDDYLWKHYTDNKHNPSTAINAFLKLKRNEIKYIFVYYQIIVIKN